MSATTFSRRLLPHALVLAGTLCASSAQALTCNSTGSGNWGSSSNWSCGVVPNGNDDVNIGSGHTISLNNDRDVRNFTIAAGGQLNDTGDDLTINNNGNVAINGTWNGAGSGRLVKNGTGTLAGTGAISGNTRIDINNDTTIPAGSNLTFTDTVNGRIDIGSFDSLTNNGTVTVARVTGGSSANWINAANAILNVTNDLFGTGGRLNAGAGGNTVNYSGGGDQDVLLPVNATYFHLTLSGGGTKTLANVFTFEIHGNLAIAAGVTYDGDTRDPAVNLAGNFSNQGIFNSGTRLFTFNGSAAQTFTGTPGGTTTLSRVDLNNPNGLSMIGTHDMRVTGSLRLDNGRITTNANVIFMDMLTPATIGAVNAGRFVVGNLRKRYPAGSNVTQQFEVGTEAGGIRYTPVTTARFGQVTSAGTLTVSTTAGDHPGIGSSTLDASKSVNRYWTLTRDGSLAFTAHASNRIDFNFINPGDIDPGAATGAFFVGRYTAGAWTEITPSSRTATRTTISGVAIASANVTGDYQVAEKAQAGTVPGSFNAFEPGTAAGAVTGYIQTKVAGTGFTLHVVAIVSGAQFSTFNSNVTVELLGNAATGVALDAQNCPVSFTVLQTISPAAIAGGRSAVSFAAVPNSWRDVRVRVRYPTSTPTVTGCSTDNFAIRPASFALAVSDATWSTAGTARSLANTSAAGGNVHQSGQPFTLTITPAPGTATNYDGSPLVGALSCTLPGGCTNGTFTPGAFAGSGTRATDTAAYSEAGSFDLTLVDQDYAGVDNKPGDTTPADCSATGRYVCQSPAPLAVGRFVPDRFEFAGPSAPVLLTFNTAGCGPRAFTYIGQPFWFATLPSATLNAVNAAGGVTTNYSVTAARPTVTETYADGAAPVLAPLNTSAVGAPSLTAGAGTGTYSGAAIGGGARLSYDRHPSTPVGAFAAAISLTVNATDSSEAAVTGNGTITSTTPLVFNGGGSGIAFDAGSQLRYGRMQIGSASGSPLVPLAVTLETQFWNGASFATNIDDNCTTIATANIGLGNYAGNLNTGETTPALAAGAFAAGKKTLTLSAPGAGNSGSVDLVVNIGTAVDSCTAFGAPAPTPAGANLSWLRGRWCGSTQSKDPTGRATFGVYLGAQETIYVRENF